MTDHIMQFKVKSTSYSIVRKRNREGFIVLIFLSDSKLWNSRTDVCKIERKTTVSCDHLVLILPLRRCGAVVNYIF